MAKMFYTLEEAAAKLGKSEADVKAMVTSGQLQEFRDRDKLMFKVDQVDLLATSVDDDLDLGGNASDMSSMIPLMDSSSGDSVIPLAGSSAGSMSEFSLEDDDGGSALADLGDLSDPEPAPAPKAEDKPKPTKSTLGGSGSGLLGGSEELSLESGAGSMGMSGSASGYALEDKGKTGVSIFDADELEGADPSAVTQVSSGGGLDDLNLEPLGSGSGLMDLTRESDDTSLGTEFLDEVYPGEEEGAQPAAASAPGASGVGGLFEGEGDGGFVGAVPVGAMVISAEPYDGAGSGFAAGLAIGAALCLAIGLTSVLLGMLGVSGGLLGMLKLPSSLWPWGMIGIMAGVTFVFGGIGWALFRGK